MNKFLFRVVLPVGIVVVAIACTGVMVMLKPAAARVDAQVVATPVEVVPVQGRTLPARIQANGTVDAAQRVSLVPEVSGRITWVSDALAPGGRFEKGEVLARIDDRDYALMVRQEKSRVRQAELELELEQGRQKVAAREWELLRSDRSGDEAPLALRRPQLATVEVALEAARGGLERAELALERTRLRAPFNAVVVSENLDVGQVVAPGSPAATLVGTDRYWVKVAVGVEDLGMLDLQGGSSAQVVQQLGDGQRVERAGTVLQLGGELDPQTRTASVIVEIRDPLGQTEGLPLLPGAYVEVTLEGRPVDQVYEVPRVAVVNGDVVLVATGEGTLERREVEVLWGSDRTVAVHGALADGDRVITSAIATPIDGMPVRVVEGAVGSAGDADEDPTESM